MDRKQQVLLKLKPKVKAFGFNKKEVMGIAARIADNLTSTDDASDEDVNAEIEAAIDAVLPYLQVSQSFANRVIEENRKKNGDDETDDGDDTSSNYNQECADAGLSTLANPPAASGKSSGKQDEVISDAEIKALADTF